MVVSNTAEYCIVAKKNTKKYSFIIPYSTFSVSGDGGGGQILVADKFDLRTN